MSDKRARTLFEVVREQIRIRHYSPRTEKTYIGWIRRFVRFYGRRHPREMGAKEVTAYLSYLATERKVAASTQNQALQALLFLYRHVLEAELPLLDSVVRAHRPRRLPVVLTQEEVRRIYGHAEGRARAPGVMLPTALKRKYPGGPTSGPWQFIFPARALCRDPYDGGLVRYHVHPRSIQRIVQVAARRAGIDKPVGPHTFRHCFATHVPNRGGLAVRSPMDALE
jgi:site-specific recombinase XerD